MYILLWSQAMLIIVNKVGSTLSLYQDNCGLLSSTENKQNSSYV